MPQLGLGNTLPKISMSSGQNLFISTWKTDNTSVGSSNNDQVKLPLEATGIYNFIVDWGDGNKDTITVWNQAEVTHTYSSIGTYIIKIKGQIEGFCFNNTLDRLKLLSIDNSANLLVGNSTGKFYGCANLTSVDKINTENVTNMEDMFRGCTNFNQNLDFLNTSNALTMDAMFRDCTNFNQNLNFNTPNLNNMGAMFINCSNFNSSINIDTSNVTNMYATLYNCASFNKDISNLNIESVLNMTLFSVYSFNWSTENYDLALISWAGQNVQSGVTFACSSNYTLGGSAETARSYLIGTKGWTISDLGGV